MDGNFPQGGVVRGGASSYGGGFDLRVHQQESMNRLNNPNSRPILHEGLPFTMVTGQTCDHQNQGERESEDDEEPSEECGGGGDGHNKSGKGSSSSPWQRVKWSDKMVKLLITAVSYIGDDSSVDGGGGSRRKFAVLQKKGKWKSVSKAMAERGHHVSPQQCEDKFNDLNKRYKKLNDMLGRGTCCQVVENPALLDSIGYLNDKEKDDVRKIMSSKHLFYEEMCSYHNGNRLHLPHDLALQRSLQLALRNREDHDNEELRRQDLDEEDDHDGEGDEYEEHCGGVRGGPLKRTRQSHEDGDHPSLVNSLESNRVSLAQMPDVNQGGAESGRAASMQKEWYESRSLQLEEQKLQIKVELLELEKQRFRWQRFSKKRDQELERMRMENERMKLENDRMGLELKQRELGVEL
ncbi:unnamed protein product [Microthlaspi erraticum]|uniref:Myb/SANT-like DNA-binding domain-containing protein n=1 Tax=Microthlaspi erraticum TaxID=1685480 RepID=A0A6D2KEL4_9BRAS|nr:unnamed protein product [Microthlaspi erraticum]